MTPTPLQLQHGGDKGGQSPALPVPSKGSLGQDGSLLWTLFPTPKVWGSRGTTSPAQGGFPRPQSLLWAQTKGQWLWMRLCQSSCFRNAQPDSRHDQLFCNRSTPTSGLPSGSRVPFTTSPPGSSRAPAARQRLSSAPDDNLLYVLSASLPCPPAFSLFTRCFLRRCIFSYNIMSDPDFPKSTLSGLAASPVCLPAGLDRGPSSVK